MKTRTLLIITIGLLMAVVGFAMTVSIDASAWQPAGQGRQGVMGVPPPGPRGGGPGRGFGGPGGIGPMLFQLDLTAAQLEQVKALMQAEREASAPHHETLQGINEQMRKAVESGEFDEAAVRALASKEAAVTVELRVIGARTQAAIYKLLTDEQKKTLADFRDDQPPRGRRGRGARGLTHSVVPSVLRVPAAAGV